MLEFGRPETVTAAGNRPGRRVKTDAPIVVGVSRGAEGPGGSNIYPREVEEVLLQHPDVLEAAVVGRRHPEWTEEMAAFVVPREGRVVDPWEDAGLIVAMDNDVPGLIRQIGASAAGRDPPP